MPRRVMFLLLLLLAGSSALFAHPGSGIVVDARGYVYFIDTAAGVWRIDPDGKLTKYGGPSFHWLALDEKSMFAAGQLPALRSAEIIAVGDQPTLLASSDFPIAVGQDGSLYYPELGADQRLRMIRFTASGVKSVSAIISASLKQINGIATDEHGSIYFTEDRRIRKIDPRGRISTVATNVRVERCASIPGIEREICPYLRGLAVAADGAIYVAASGCGAVVKIANGRTTVVSRSAPPWSPTAVALAKDGVYVLEYLHTVAEDRPAWVPRVRRISSTGRISTIAAVSR